MPFDKKGKEEYGQDWCINIEEFDAEELEKNETDAKSYAYRLGASLVCIFSLYFS
jgi:hypothetical protein